MGGMLSQEEIDALLGGGSTEPEPTPEKKNKQERLTDQEKDTLGEIGNISMGTAATTLSALLNQKVSITTPKIEMKDFDTILQGYDKLVAIKVGYKEGLIGENILFLKEKDVKIIADLMMGGDGTKTDEELSELHLSAMGEAMNQMIGSASTSMSAMFKKKIDIMPPVATPITMGQDIEKLKELGLAQEDMVEVSFRMQVGDLIDSEIMQVIPIDFSKELVNILMNTNNNSTPEKSEKKQVTKEPQSSMEVSNATHQESNNTLNPNVQVKPVQFSNFNQSPTMHQKENIDIIRDVSLEITVELGRTNRSIKEILEMGPGTIIDLDKIAGEPIDILVNGTFIAKGEVVVIDEKFGIRVTEIVDPQRRI